MPSVPFVSTADAHRVFSSIHRALFAWCVVRGLCCIPVSSQSCAQPVHARVLENACHGVEHALGRLGAYDTCLKGRAV
jgi:hypothetical protein